VGPAVPPRSTARRPVLFPDMPPTHRSVIGRPPRRRSNRSASFRAGVPGGLRPVTVFDADIPPGVAFIRSLGRAGVPVVVGVSRRSSVGRFSRYATDLVSCPPTSDTDAFVAWLSDRFSAGSIGLVAPTSDYVSFCVSEALERLGYASAAAGHPVAAAVRTSLFKDRFGAAMESIGFPTPAWAVPSSPDEALAAATQIGYPLVLKPRIHVGVGNTRGAVVRSPAELASAFRPFRLRDGSTTVLDRDPHVALPIVQGYHELGTVDVVSLTGCLDTDGSVLAFDHCRKVSQSPRRLGVGTMFEPVVEPSFARAALEAIRGVLGSGLFELEVLVDRTTGEYWALDLNPRGFGQMSLDIALGNDLPRLWYGSVTGAPVPTTAPATPRPQFWHEATSTYVGSAVLLARGPGRVETAKHAFRRMTTPSVNAMFDKRDPVPGLLFGLRRLRHLRSFVRPFLVDVELAAANPMVAPPTITPVSNAACGDPPA
jgi:D-aspartate ligase